MALPGDPFAPAGPAAPKARTEARRKRTLLEILTFGLLGKPPAAVTLVQCEMALEGVRVIRNDLADSDLEVVVNKKKKFALGKKTPPTLSHPEAKPEKPSRWQLKKRDQWSELTVRLFEIGQH